MRKLLAYISLLFCVGLSAQTSNKGILYISEGVQFSTVETLNNLTTGEFYNDGESFIYSHFNNDGTLDFYEETGVTHFIGSDDQIISGANPSYLQNINFNNRSYTSPFLLTGELDINGLVHFERGVLDNRNYGGEITFGNNAKHIHTSNYSHVDGTVKKVGVTEFQFPIGHQGHYRFGAISAPSISSTLFKGSYYLENSNPSYPHERKESSIKKINDKEYWIIEPHTDNEEVLITISWYEATTPSFIIDAAEHELIHIVRWDEETNQWIDEGGAIDLDEESITAAVSGYGVFSLATTRMKNPGDLLVYNAITPDGDGINDYLFIDIPEDGSVRDLKVMVFNRWGVKVYESNNYGIDGDVFSGFSSGRLTIDNSKKLLPTGTYFYTLNYEYGDSLEKNRHRQAGYLYISKSD